MHFSAFYQQSSWQFYKMNTVIVLILQMANSERSSNLSKVTEVVRHRIRNPVQVICVSGMWCVGRDTGIVSHSQAKDSTVCAPARVCMCACTRVCAWRGPGVCVLGGGGGGGVWRVCDMPRWCCVVGVCSPGVRLWVREAFQ